MLKIKTLSICNFEPQIVRIILLLLISQVFADNGRVLNFGDCFHALKREK